MDVGISKLPNEVLVHIFQFLSFEDRKTVSLVYKQWLHAVDCHEMLCDIRIKFSKNVDGAVELFSRMTRKFEYFSFYEVTIGDCEFEFLEKYSKQFVTLYFMKCKLTDTWKSKSQDKSLHWDNLRSLELKHSNICSLFASVPNVTTLKLHLPSDLSDYIISEFNKSLGKLEELSLGGNLSNDVRVSRRYDDEKVEIQTNPSKLFLSYASIKMLIEKNRTTLKTFDFLDLQMSPETTLNISRIRGLQLRNVSFPLNFNSGYIKKFCENQFSLTSLDLSFKSLDMDDTMCAICKSLTNLQELIIKFNHAIDTCIIEIFQLQHLVKLNLSHSNGVSEISYREAVSNLKAFKLKHLNLTCAKIGDDSLFKLLKLNQNIRHLNVTRTSISDETLNMICKNLIFLDCLILDSCWSISDSGLTGEFDNYSDSITPTPLSNLKHLKELNLSRNPFITNQGCIKSIRFLKLEHLYLSECDALVLEKDFEIQLRKQNPSLELFLAFP